MTISRWKIWPHYCFNSRKGDNMRNLTECNNGFTLIELLIVVAIIGILAAIAIPQFNSYRTRAYNSSAVSDLKTLETSLEAYLHDYAHFPSIP
jgi:type IV pilus assembly protein PilA